MADDAARSAGRGSRVPLESRTPHNRADDIDDGPRSTVLGSDLKKTFSTWLDNYKNWRIIP